MSDFDPNAAWMTLEEVASYLKLSRTKLYELAQAGAIPCSKVAGRWRFYRPEVDQWMLAQRPGPPDHKEDDRE